MDTDSKPCPVCGEPIKAVAIKCRFCNTDLVAFTKSQLLDNEQPLFSGRPAVIYKITQFIPFAALVILFVIGYAMGISGQQVLYLALSLVTVGCLIYLLQFLTSLSTRYTITTQRITIEHGLFSLTKESLEVFRIDHFEIRKPFTWRLLGQAKLHLFSSDAELLNFTVYAIPNIDGLANTLRECQLRERARRGLATIVRA